MGKILKYTQKSFINDNRLGYPEFDKEAINQQIRHELESLLMRLNLKQIENEKESN